MAANISFSLAKVDPKGDGTSISYAGRVNIDEYKSEDQIVEALAQRMGEDKTTIKALAEALKEQIIANAKNGCAVSNPEFLKIANYCRGSFTTAKGPWVPGVNRLVPTATTMGEFRTAYDGATMTNAVSALTPRIDSIVDNTTHTEGVIKKGDTIYISGNNFSLDTSKTDECVQLRDADGAIKAACTVSRCDRMSIDCTFSTTLAAGVYYLWVNTRCGQGDDYAVRTAKMAVTVAV